MRKVTFTYYTESHNSPTKKGFWSEERNGLFHGFDALMQDSRAVVEDIETGKIHLVPSEQITFAQATSAPLIASELTALDHFAGLAMQSILHKDKVSIYVWDTPKYINDIAELSYKQAAAMIEARKSYIN